MEYENGLLYYSQFIVFINIIRTLLPRTQVSHLIKPTLHDNRSICENDFNFVGPRTLDVQATQPSWISATELPTRKPYELKVSI